MDGHTRTHTRTHRAREREREREGEGESETERASPTRFLLRRAPKMLPACDRVTAHHCEALRVRRGKIMQRREKTHRHRLPEESRASARVYVCVRVCICVCVCMCECVYVCACM